MQKRLIALLVLMLVGAGSAAAQTTRPQNTVRPTISGAAKQGEVLTADRLCPGPRAWISRSRSEEHTSELQSRGHLVCRLLLEKKKYKHSPTHTHEQY